MGHELRSRQSDMQSDSQTFRQSFVGPCAGLVRDLQKYRDPELFLWSLRDPSQGSTIILPPRHRLTVYLSRLTVCLFASDCLTVFPWGSDCLLFILGPKRMLCL